MSDLKRVCLLAALISTGCSACGGEAAVGHDARPLPDPDDPGDATLLDMEWEAVIAESSQDVMDAVMLPTGIAVLSPPDLFLVDKNDGHVIAHAPWPTGDVGTGVGWPIDLFGAIARESGNLAITALRRTQAEPQASLMLYEFDKDDLSLVREVLVSGDDDVLGGSLTEQAGSLFVLTLFNPEPDQYSNVLHRIDDKGEITVQTIGNDFYHGPIQEGVTYGKTLVYCAGRSMLGGAAILRIDPATGKLDRIDVEGISSVDTHMIASPDRLLCFWRGENASHWEILSRDGTEILASHTEERFPLTHNHAYVDGDFVTIDHHDSGVLLWTVDAHTGWLRGPYDVPAHDGGPGNHRPAVVSDGENLYAVISPGNLRLVKLAPLPD